MVSASLNYRVKRKLEVFYSGGPIAVLPGEETLACACGDEVKIVSLSTGAVLQTFPGDSEPVTALTASPDGKTVFAASRSLALRAWDVESGRVKQAFRGHRGPVAAAAMHASGSLLATCSTDRTTRLWDVEGGYCTHSFGGHRGVVLAVAFVPGDLSVVSGGDDGEIRIWDLVTKTCSSVLRGHSSAVTSLSVSVDGRLLASGARDSTVRLWDVRAHAPLATVPIFEAVEAVALLPKEESRRWIGDGGFPGAKTGAAGQAISGGVLPSDPRRAVAFAVGGERGRLRVFRGDSAACVWEQPADDGAATEAGPLVDVKVLFNGGPRAGSTPARQAVLSATQDGRLLVHEPASLPPAAASSKGPCPSLRLARHLIGNNDEITAALAVHVGSPVLTAGSTPAPTHVVVATNSEVVRVLSLDGSMSCGAALTGHRGAVLAAAAARDGAGGVLVATAGKDAAVLVHRIVRAAPLVPEAGALGAAAYVPTAPGGGAPAASCAACAAARTSTPLSSGSTAAAPSPATSAASSTPARASTTRRSTPTASASTSIQASLAASGSGHVGAVSALAWAPRRRRLLASGGADGLLKLWEVADLLAEGAEVGVEAGGEPEAPAPRPAAAAARLVPGAATAAHDKDVNAVAFSPDDSLVATASSDRTARLFSAPDLVPVRTLKGHRRGVWDVAFSPVDRLLATASADATLRLWSAVDGSCLRTFEGHGASVLRVRFLAAGTALASTGSDGLLKLWSTRAGEATASLDAAEDKVWALDAAGPSDATLVTGGADGALVVWEDCTAEELDLAAEQSLADLQGEQQLANALKTGDLSAAAKLAFRLKQPGRLLSVAQRALAADVAAAALGPVAAAAGPDDLRRLLEYARDWNASPRSCLAAHALLRAVLSTHPSDEILALPGALGLLEALASYSRRHLARLDRLHRDTFLLEHVLDAADVLVPEDQRA